MSDQINTNPSMFAGRWPMRRVIAVSIAGAVALSGVVGALTGANTGVNAEPAYTIIDRTDRLIDIRDTDGERWTCVSEISVDTCVMDAQQPGGAVELLGYRTVSDASEHCPNGTVTPNWRRNQIVGYGCLINWQDSLQR